MTDERPLADEPPDEVTRRILSYRDNPPPPADGKGYDIDFVDADWQRAVRTLEFQIDLVRRSPGRTDRTTLGEAWAATPMEQTVRLMAEHGVTVEMLLDVFVAEAHVRTQPVSPGAA